MDGYNFGLLREPPIKKVNSLAVLTKRQKDQGTPVCGHGMAVVLATGTR